MKKFLAGGAIVIAALFSIQPATAADPVPAPTPAVEAPVTASDAPVTFTKPSVTTTPKAPGWYIPPPGQGKQDDVNPDDYRPTPQPPAPAPTIPDTVEPAPVADIVAPVVLNEDDPAWDCNSMGNLLCGGAQYPVSPNVEDKLLPQCADPATIDPAVLRWCDWKAANP